MLSRPPCGKHTKDWENIQFFNVHANVNGLTADYLTYQSSTTKHIMSQSNRLCVTVQPFPSRQCSVTCPSPSVFWSQNTSLSIQTRLRDGLSGIRGSIFDAGSDSSLLIFQAGFEASYPIATSCSFATVKYIGT